MSRRDLSPAALFELAVGGERRSLGRLLTLVERGGPDADTITELSYRAGGAGHVVGITGAPGAGKSTLVGQLVRTIAEAGKRPAVLAVDPSSPLSGGAILGDRVRMDDVVADHDAFIRSMATRGHQGGLALAIPGAVRVLDAAGYDPVIIETVGVGQVEVDVAAAADTTVVVVNPGWGDAVQANKAGLLEVADIFVVNKADRPGAGDARRDLELMLDLSHVSGQEDEGFRPEIVLTTATDGTGAAEVVAAIDAHRAHLGTGDRLAARRRAQVREEIRVRLEQLLGHRIDEAVADDPTGDIARATAGDLSPAAAATAALTDLLSGES